MTVIAVTETWHGRKISADQKAQEFQYGRSFNIITDSDLDGPQTVRYAAGIPRAFDPYVEADGKYEPYALCSHVEITQNAEIPRLWHAEAHYSTGSGQDGKNQKDPTKENKDPLQRRAGISFDTVKFQRALEKDLTGRCIRNSAGDPFDPPLEVDDSRPTLTIERNEASFNNVVFLAYQDAVNNDVFFGFNPGCAKVDKIGVKEQFEKNQLFYRVTYVFHFRYDGWRLRPLDRGYRVFNIGECGALLRRQR